MNLTFHDTYWKIVLIKYDHEGKYSIYVSAWTFTGLILGRNELNSPDMMELPMAWWTSWSILFVNYNYRPVGNCKITTKESKIHKRHSLVGIVYTHVRLVKRSTSFWQNIILMYRLDLLTVTNFDLFLSLTVTYPIESYPCSTGYQINHNVSVSSAPKNKKTCSQQSKTILK